MERSPRISLIAAMDENRAIGKGGGLPWHSPADLKRFRELTMGHSLIVGRKTWESIGRSLPGRRIIVLTRQESFAGEGCSIAHDLQEAVRLAGDDPEVFIGGGEEIFRQALPSARRIFLTVVHGTYEGDTFFPEIPSDFAEKERVEVPAIPSCTFLTYERRQ